MHGTFSILPLRAAGLTYAVRGRSLVDDVSFEIARGTRTVIMGPNGAGKSLTLRLCHGLLEPTSGSITWNGAVHDHGRKRHAMVFQRPVMLRRSAFANISYALSLARILK
jgi:tungstate transport system ATP-binding protein